MEFGSWLHILITLIIGIPISISAHLQELSKRDLEK